MISTASVHSFAERKTKNLFSMRPAWLKKDSSAAESAATMASSPESPKIKELASSTHGKLKTLSRPRIRELLTIAMIRLMERMIAELFPCGEEEDSGFGNANTGSNETSTGAPLPSFEEFLKHICRRTRTPLTCMCLALLYLTRLRANHPRSRGSPGSSYRLALSSLCVATKYLYDDAYHTCSWVQVSMGLFSQREVNQMEMEFMYFLHYQLGVTPNEWNQWIATLEAKLVARWQEKGKAEVIYGFGLFLSYECCEPNSQEAVRDIAWGEGGKNLLSLLNNAIHSSGNGTVGGGIDNNNNSTSNSNDSNGNGKCSPSADSAVSDTTCLPTPDPNSWFRIRSPALSGAGEPSELDHPQTIPAASSTAATAAVSSSITPTSARMPDVCAGSSDDSTPFSSVHQTLRGTGSSRHSYVEHLNVSPGAYKHAGGPPPPPPQSGGSARHYVQQAHNVPSYHSLNMRAVSVCSVPAMTTTEAGLYNDYSLKGVALSVSGAGSHHATYRHASDSKTQDWRSFQHTPVYPHEPSPSSQKPFRDSAQQQHYQLGSGSTASFGTSANHHASSTASPFNNGLSGNTATMSLSYSADSKDDSGVLVPDHGALGGRRLGASASGRMSQTTANFSTGPRGPASGSSSVVRGSSSSTIPFDTKYGYSAYPTLPRNSTIVISSRDTRGNDAPGAVEFAPPPREPSKPVTRRPPCTASLASDMSIVAASPGATDIGSARHLGNHAVASTSCAPSAKSSASSLRVSSRRHSWRHHGAKTSGGSASFAQKIRSFATFWGASGGNGGAPNHGSGISPQMKDRLVCDSMDN